MWLLIPDIQEESVRVIAAKLASRESDIDRVKPLN